MQLSISVMANAMLLLAAAGFASAAPRPWSVPQEHFEVMSLRQNTPLNPDSVSDVECWNTHAHIVYHEQNAAQLAICDGGLAGGKDDKKTTRCATGASSTVGRRGSAKFTLTATTPGATINISKRRWEECVRAARDKCPTGTLTGTCLGGATSGDVVFTLESTMFAVN